VTTSGDGFLAMCDNPLRAIRDAVRSLDIEMRAGLHTGDCEIRGDDIGAIGVHVGARVSALTGPNDVLESSTPRTPLDWSGARDRGARRSRAQGALGEWRLFAVAPW
jgi:class 3 adenylate cyclase